MCWGQVKKEHLNNCFWANCMALIMGDTPQYPLYSRHSLFVTFFFKKLKLISSAHASIFHSDKLKLLWDTNDIGGCFGPKLWTTWTLLNFLTVAATFILIIFWDFLMFYQIFLWPQVKWHAITTYKRRIYKLPHKLPNNLRVRILGN